MFFNTTKKSSINKEQQEMYEHAKKRVRQKKGVVRHITYFIAGCIIFIIMGTVLNIGSNFFIPNWYQWALLIWGFIVLIHVFNVFIMHPFLSNEWEAQQIEKLIAKQEKRIEELEKKVSLEASKKTEQ